MFVLGFIIAFIIGYSKGFYDGIVTAVREGVEFLKYNGVDFSIPGEQISYLVDKYFNLIQLKAVNSVKFI